MKNNLLMVVISMDSAITIFGGNLSHSLTALTDSLNTTRKLSPLGLYSVRRCAYLPVTSIKDQLQTEAEALLKLSCTTSMGIEDTNVTPYTSRANNEF